MRWNDLIIIFGEKKATSTVNEQKQHEKNCIT